MPFLTVISGGQTGVDLAALRAAEACDLPYTGWAPLHYTNETGEYGIPERFRPALREASTTESAERTELNVREADGILTLLMETGRTQREALAGSPGTLHGIEYAQKLGKQEKQLYFVNLADADSLVDEQHNVMRWLLEQKVAKCAIGGPRESEAKGIEKEATAFLVKVFQEYKRRTSAGQP